MFPTFDVPPLHAETVGARKARVAKEQEVAKRTSSATSHSSGSIHSAKTTSNKSKAGDKGGFISFFGKKSKGIQEIQSLPSLKKSPPPAGEQDHDIAPCPPTAPLPQPPQQNLYRQPSDQSVNDVHAISPDYFPSPPLRALPSRPPTGALPPPPSTSPGLHSRPDTVGRKSQYSTYSHGSSDRTTVSNRSVFSNASQYDSAISEASYEDSPYGSNVLLEPVERGSRTGSRQSDHAAKAAQGTQGPFARALAKMENAGARIVATRLSEEWEGLEDDESYQEVIFEKRLWALTAYQRLTQNKQLQSPAHELLSNSRPADQRRILHLHGSLADGWMLATRYPAATVYTLSSMKSASPPTSYPAPLNHHSLYVPSISSATPFPDGYFDAVISRTVSTVLRNEEWARCFFDCMRTLKPGGQLDILTLDCHMSCEGPKLSAWVDDHISTRLEEEGLSMQASDTVLDTMEIVGLDNIRRARIALPAYSPRTMARPAPQPSHTFSATIPPITSQDSADASRMMSLLGRHFYQDLHGKFLHARQGEEWFWSRKDLREECERHKTKMVLTIACATKPKASPGESYLDI
ncbi:hypothetical protein HBI56_166480 [Parastagonospora nodorum]|uniref:Methyltransferase type 11 domain-containing protein n=1 Tax=Phaeosphaeria nodorum (strain SN15 / ATCC MYA-4574 / FGSC 10173) TaxID=321614 RepID=A0A7U2IBF8_PHANO|nr:hypothetical protein HBH56_074240 [Parastagonospora nodorum]QRD06757.1 hypothetical protein JI435_136580 [Parastagonospora nodorum SN15]KAH3927245.1 hypothetical protein HBH54_154480 [Parastagonospora nodorum]KAH3994820.1 hypothetical protein HBI10_181130 [Parastagonospora nodorum]KAH4015056.1 hypothetical protein HBI13_166260 [Parastagonospora nodorum]